MLQNLFIKNKIVNFIVNYNYISTQNILRKNVLLNGDKLLFNISEKDKIYKYNRNSHLISYNYVYPDGVTLKGTKII